MKGTWIGFYKYDRERAQKTIGFEKTFFTLIIHAFDGKKFEGSVTDDTESGGMEGEGKIAGQIINNTVTFQKHMPRATFLFKDGSRKITNRKHPTIYYSGTLSQDGREISGSWKIKTQIAFLFGIIPFPYNPHGGCWSMKLQ
ncbi:MAG: hypothetical protein JNM88_18390 [Chitinophagaceae bacterium]|nr:hypothetical protein [Chitinophagaceae bacterium]